MECKGCSCNNIASCIIRINRNIVECKDTYDEIDDETGECINRNIVECKGRREMYRIQKRQVLIET